MPTVTITSYFRNMLSNEMLYHITTSLQGIIQKEVRLQSVQQVFGGDINQTFVLQTNQGKFFLKTNGIALPYMFEKESAGLLLLKSTNTLDVPAPLQAGSFGQTSFLVMEWVEKGKPSKNFWQQFGHGLATMHKHTQPKFGLVDDNYIGTIRQPNGEKNTWAQFYTQQRILHLMQAALQQNKCSNGDMAAAEKLCNKFTELFPTEPPALLHGDLWGGNFMPGATGRPVIYDPAVYYGHREMDIAMTQLFGGFDKQLYQYYNEAYPLQPGWQQRVPLCQLYPLLVHLLLFGGHYYNSVMEVVRKYG